MSNKEDAMAQALFLICLMHRAKHGYGEETPIQSSDCELLACQKECPIAKMPDALTRAEIRGA